MSKLFTQRPPRLPTAPQDYEKRFHDQHSDVLRLYFNQLDNVVSALLGTRGGRFLENPYGSFYDTTDQYDGSTAIPYAMRLNTTDSASGVSVESRTVVATASIATTTMTVTAIASGRFYPGMLLSGTGVTAGSYVYLQLSSTAAVVATHNYVSGGAAGTATVVLDSVVGVEERQFVSGTGVPANTRVVLVDAGTNTVTLSANFTVQAAGAYAFRPWGYAGTYSVNPSQTVASTTITGITQSKITVNQPGIYNIQFSAQFTNTDSQAHDVDIWVKKNDVTVPESNTQYTIPSKHGAFDGHLGAALNYFVELQASDYVELVWHTANSAVFIEYIDPQTAPIRPGTPSVILTVSFVSNLPT